MSADSNLESSQHYKQLQLVCTSYPLLVPILIKQYGFLSHKFLTREVRYILEGCLTIDWVEFVNRINFEDAENTPMLLLAHKDVAGFLTKFKAQIRQYFEAESRDQANYEASHSEIRLCEIEDRSSRLIGEFEQLYEPDGGFRFLRMIRTALDLETRLITQPDAEIARDSRKRRYHSSGSTMSASSKGMLAVKLARKCAEMGELSDRLKETLANLKALCLTQDRAIRLIDLISDLCDNWLSSKESLSAVNDSLACRDLKHLDESSTTSFAHVFNTCEHFGLSERLSAQLDRLHLRTLVITHQSDRIIRAGSTCAGKYVELKLRLLFSEFFAEFRREKRTPQLHVALLNASETKTFDSGEMTLDLLTGIEAATAGMLEQFSCNWLDSHSKSDSEDSGYAQLRFRFKSRPACAKSSKVSIAAQPFALCVFFPTTNKKIVACLSKPVVFITNSNQLVTASAAVHYYTSRSPVYPLSLSPPAALSIDDVTSLIMNYVVEETSRPLNDESLDFFHEKLVTLADNSSFVQFDDLVTKSLFPKDKSLWEYLHNTIKFIKERGLAMFRDGLVFGFVTRERATSILTYHRLNGVSQPLGLLRFSQTTTTVTVALGDKHEAPKPEAHFKSVSLAEFCYSALPLEARLVSVDGTLISSEKLKAYIPKEDFIPGYVSLNREMSICSELLDINSPGGEIDMSELEGCF